MILIIILAIFASAKLSQLIAKDFEGLTKVGVFMGVFGICMFLLSIVVKILIHG